MIYWSEMGVMISPDMKRPLPELIDMKKSANTCIQGGTVNTAHKWYIHVQF